MLYSPQHNALIYPNEAPLAIAQCCPDARQLPDGRVIVPAHLANLQRLTLRGIPVIEVLDASGYNWPSKYPTPFHAQRVTANFLVLNKRAFVLSDMGTGKTLAALWAADWLMRQHHAIDEPFKAIIIAPLSTLRTVWEKECFEAFMSHRKVQILHHVDAKKRVERLNKDADFYILNHDGLKVGAKHKAGRNFELSGFAEALANRTDIRLAIVDEASAYRDHTTERSLITQLLIGSREYLWAMTGTPTPNGPPDAFGIAKLVNNAYGESFTSFKHRTMQQLGPFKWVPRTGAQVEVKKLLSPAVRFAIEDCVDLPPTTTQTREVPLSAEQDKAMKDLKKNLMLQLAKGRIDVANEAMKDLKKNLMLQLAKGRIDVANEAVLRLKLIQIACGAIYDSAHVAHYIDATPRLNELLEVIEESARKTIIFAPLTSVVEMLNTKLTKLTKHKVSMIHGGVSPNARAKIFQDFQDGGEGSAHLLVADAGTMSHGLTLTAATTICWYGPSERTEIYLQANKRIARPGQQFPTTIVQLASTPTEREIYKRLANNESMQGVMLKLAEQ